MAVENLERYCDELENRLLEKFERYEAKRDVVGMRQCARTISHFNGGASLVQRFVATRPMFLKVEALERLDALRDFAPAYGSGLAEEKEAADAAEAALEALDVFFQRRSRRRRKRWRPRAPCSPRGATPWTSSWDGSWSNG